MIYTSIYQVIHDIYWYIPLLYIVVYTNPLHCCRIPLLLSLHFCTALRRISTMFPWRIVGMPVPSSSSIVLCVQRMGNCLKTNTAMLALMTLFTPWFSSIHLKEAGFPFACADTTALGERRGSNIYEVNPWLWQFGRCKPCLRGLSIEQTVERKDAASDAWHKHAAETRRAHKTAQA